MQHAHWPPFWKENAANLAAWWARHIYRMLRQQQCLAQDETSISSWMRVMHPTEDEFPNLQKAYVYSPYKYAFCVNTQPSASITASATFHFIFLISFHFISFSVLF